MFQCCLLNRLTLCHCITFFLVKNWLSVFMQVYFRPLIFFFFFLPLIYLTILLLVPQCLNYCSCIMSWSWVVLILQMCSSLSMLCWLFWGFWFLCKLLNQFINIYKITSWNFGWDCIEDQLGKNWHLANTESFYLWM